MSSDLPADISKAARNKQIIEEHFGMALPRRLSAIEEALTIKSLNDIITSSPTQPSLKDMEFTIEESPNER